MVLKCVFKTIQLGGHKRPCVYNLVLQYHWLVFVYRQVLYSFVNYFVRLYSIVYFDKSQGVISDVYSARAWKIQKFSHWYLIYTTFSGAGCGR